MGVLRTNFHLKWIFRIIAEVKKKSSWSEKKKKKQDYQEQVVLQEHSFLWAPEREPAKNLYHGF